jgi:hypothetical protein
MTTYTSTNTTNTFNGTTYSFGLTLTTDDTNLIAKTNLFTPDKFLLFNLSNGGQFCGGSSEDDIIVTGDVAFQGVGAVKTLNVILSITQATITVNSGRNAATFQSSTTTIQAPSQNITPSANFPTSTPAFFPACFQKGTHILTPDGEKPVELLQTGDLVISAKTGKSVPIKSMMCFFGTQANCPLYCLPKDALGENKPTRDLFLSHRHRVSLDGQLRHMVCLADMGKSVPTGKEVIEYYHIELADCFDTVVAEGLEVETFIDPRVVGHDWECTSACCTYIPIGPQPTSIVVERLAITA